MKKTNNTYNTNYTYILFFSVLSQRKISRVAESDAKSGCEGFSRAVAESGEMRQTSQIFNIF